MKHRHIETEDLTLAAIDDIIERGRRCDWHDLRVRADADMSIVERIIKVCARRIADPYAQRHIAWSNYARTFFA